MGENALVKFHATFKKLSDARACLLYHVGYKKYGGIIWTMTLHIISGIVIARDDQRTDAHWSPGVTESDH